MTTKPQWETVGVLRHEAFSNRPAPSLPQTEPHTSPSAIVVLGKKSVRRDEISALRDFGHAIALRGQTLITTKTPGAPEHIAAGYTDAGGTVQYLKKDEQPDPSLPVFIFTSTKLQNDLDSDRPGWRERGWIIIHNPKETIDAARFVRMITKSRGTPLPDGG